MCAKVNKIHTKESMISLKHWTLDNLVVFKYMMKMLFNLRSSIIKGIQMNFPSILREDMTCRLNCSDPEAIDNQQHLLTCSVIHDNISHDDSRQARHLSYDYIFGSLDQQRKAVLVLARLVEVREDILENESLPVGANWT